MTDAAAATTLTPAQCAAHDFVSRFDWQLAEETLEQRFPDDVPKSEAQIRNPNPG
jgi:hypothetical protein